MIIILVILSTIAFIYFQEYIADSRNYKRTSDLNYLVSVLEIHKSGSIPLLSFVISNTGSKLSYTSSSIAGSNITKDDYDAGIPNYSTMGIKEEEFKDPNGQDYRIGATTKINGKYEFAASMESSFGKKIAKVQGTYNPRIDIIVNTISTDWGKRVTLDKSDINKLKVWDEVGEKKIIAVSSDGLTLTFDWEPTLQTSPTDSTSSLKLANEVVGLIKANSNPISTGAVTDGQSDKLPY